MKKEVKKKSTVKAKVKTNTKLKTKRAIEARNSAEVWNLCNIVGTKGVSAKVKVEANKQLLKLIKN